ILAPTTELEAKELLEWKRRSTSRPSTGTRPPASSRRDARPSSRSRSCAEGEMRSGAVLTHTSSVKSEPSAATGRSVVIADDDLLLREGLASLLTLSGYDVVGQAGDATILLDLVREHRPDLAIVDIRMPPDHTTEGLRAAQAIREESPETAILVLSAYVEVM